jgi:hypothetical protein
MGDAFTSLSKDENPDGWVVANLPSKSAAMNWIDARMG